ncbi:hypothetical protein HanRHA438_Chr12g0563041 [Helianthus annuus]|nr:hypothetical protein HanRHA438_Chr12g0563041 [Helianthus annuus]
MKRRKVNDEDGGGATPTTASGRPASWRQWWCYLGLLRFRFWFQLSSDLNLVLGSAVLGSVQVSRVSSIISVKCRFKSDCFCYFSWFGFHGTG